MQSDWNNQPDVGDWVTAGIAEPIEEPAATPIGELTVSAMSLLNQHIHIFVIAFLVTLLITPFIRRMAIAHDIIDHPDSTRKVHPYPVAYLGGLAVFLGIIAAIAASYMYRSEQVASFMPVPIAIVIGMVAITFTGLADDIWGWDPRLKIAGQLVAAAALAIEEVGVMVAAGVLNPIFGSENLIFAIPTPIGAIPFDVVYWVGTGLIAVFVLGGCNAANLLDGLDGLLSGIVAIVAVGLLLISLLLATTTIGAAEVVDAQSLAGARIVLCMALLGAVLGFLPHNFNPATIFLGDSGSLLLGYMCVVIILMFGDMGQTHLVFAGLIVFSLPIIDTTLAIIRRVLAGTSLSAADDQHIHHQFKRSLGGVKRAVMALYAIGLSFMVVGVILAALVVHTDLRVRFIYVIALVLFSFIAVIAVKAARKQQLLLGIAPEHERVVASSGPDQSNAASADGAKRRSRSDAPSKPSTTSA